MPSTAFRKTDLRRFHFCEFEWSKITIKVFEKSKRVTFFAIFSSIYQKFFLDFVHHNNSDVKVKRIRILIASSILYIYFPCHNLLLFSSFLFTFKSEFFWSHSIHFKKIRKHLGNFLLILQYRNLKGVFFAHL